jgi:hypothetical protein
MSRQNYSRPQQMNERTQSAQQDQNFKALQGPNMDKRTLSASENKADPYGFQNRLSQKLQGFNNDVYLEFSTQKALEDFSTNNFDSASGGEQDTDRPESQIKSKKPPLYGGQPTSEKKFDSYEAKIKQSPQNPYRGGRTELTQRLKKL